MSDLLVATHTPVLRSGQAVRTYGVARALAAHGGLTLLYTRFDAPEPDEAFRAIPGIELCEVVPSRGARRLLAYGRARLAGVPAGFARGISRELAAEATRLAAAPGRGRVIADGPIAAATLAGLARERPVIYNAHNLESAFRHELGARGARERASLRKFERGLLQRSSESWMVSQADLDAARELCRDAHLRYVPNVVDVSAIEPVRSTEREAASGSAAALASATRPQRVAFVASFAYEPNRNGLRFLLEEVFPRVWEQAPETELVLVGTGLDEPPSSDPRVRVLGFVEHLRDAYANVDCVAVPLLQGGGTPLKFIEALAYGLPVVATPRAAAGLEVRDSEHCLIAGDGEEFARAILRVLQGDESELGRNGRELVKRSYSIEALSDLLVPASPADPPEPPAQPS